MYDHLSAVKNENEKIVRQFYKQLYLKRKALRERKILDNRAREWLRLMTGKPDPQDILL